MGLIKTIFIIIGIAAALVAVRKYQIAAGKIGGDSPGGGFVEVSRPTDAPPGKVLIIGPKNCTSETVARIDALERSIHAAGIPCVRSQSGAFSSVDRAEAKRISRLLSGELPIVVVGNYAKNNPTLNEIKAQVQASRRR